MLHHFHIQLSCVLDIKDQDQGQVRAYWDTEKPSEAGSGCIINMYSSDKRLPCEVLGSLCPVWWQGSLLENQLTSYPEFLPSLLFKRPEAVSY